MGFLMRRGAPQVRVATLSDVFTSQRRMGLRMGSQYVNVDSAMTHSAVWAATRIRADLESTTPLKFFRPRNGQSVAVPRPAFFTSPFGDPRTDVNAMTWAEWMYASRVELDRSGCSFGVITSRDGSNNPREIELVGDRDLSVTVFGPRILEVRVRGAKIPLSEVWLETQYQLAGSPIGLSPVLNAARSLGGYLSAQQAAADHWAMGLNPGGILKNTERRIVNNKQIDAAKAAFAAAIQDRGLFVHGAEWEWSPVAVAGVEQSLIDELRWSVSDIARFFGVPGDLIDAAQSGTSVTYANISQRTLQFLVFHLGPMMKRRESNFQNRILPAGWLCEFDTDDLLRMDQEQRLKLTARQLQNRIITNDEARGRYNLEPLTPEELARENEIYGAPAQYTQPSDDSSGKVGQSGGN